MDANTYVMGQRVEIRAEEVEALRNCASKMRVEANVQARGWVYRYLVQHRMAGSIFRRVVERAHAIPGPERESRR